MKSRRARSEIVELISISMPWEEICVDGMSSADLATFKHRKDALERYVKGEPLKLVKTATGVGGGFLRKIIARCLIVAPDGSLYGYRALIPNFAIKTYARKKPLSMRLGVNGSGYSGSLGALFERYPNVHKALDDFILKMKDTKGREPTHKFSNRPKDIHYEFIKLIEKASHPKNEWPFTSHYLGSRTISDYVKKLREKNFEQTVRLVGDKAAVAHLNVGTGVSPVIRWRGLNDGWQIDTHTFDSAFVIGIPNSAGLISWKKLKRLHVIVAIESYLSPVMWYRVVYGDDVTAQDIIALIREALGKDLPEPEQIVPNLVAKKGAGFPSKIFPEINQSPPSVIQFDNALAHLTTQVISELRKQIGCVLEYGPPGHFERRPDIENFFKQFTQELGQRMRSSTGTRPNAGGDKNPGEAAVVYTIESKVLEQLTYVTLANLNAEPNEGLGFLTPIEAIRQLLERDNQHFLPRKLPGDRRNLIGTGLVRERRTVKGGFDSGLRPYVNFERGRYTSVRFQEATNLFGKEIVVEINESDITVIYAYLDTGEPLGPLTVQGVWALTPHSRKTRKEINSLRYKKIISFTDGENAIAVYNAYLTEQLAGESLRARQERKIASEVDRLTHEVSLGSTVIDPFERVEQPSPVKVDKPVPVREWVLPVNVIDLHALVKKMK